MNFPTPTNTRSRSERPAFSLLEVVVSMFLMGTVMVVAMEALVSTSAGRSDNGNRAQALLLAQILVEEILDQPYLEIDAAAAFGPEAGEADSGTRADFDDVDDYHAWSASPPEDKNGVDLPLSGDWSREVLVRWVSAGDVEASSGSDEGWKRVEVTVEYKGQPAASLAVTVTRARQVPPLPVP